MSTAWRAALHELGEELDRLERVALSGEGDDAEPWRPPEDLGPLPGDLRDDVARLLRRVTSVRARITAERDRLSADLEDADRRRSAADRYLGRA